MKHASSANARCLGWMRVNKTAVALLLLFAAEQSRAAENQIGRIVIIKADGLPERYVERYSGENAGGGRNGQSKLPWIHHVFGENGAWLENFYVRGQSLSAPSWSMLDAGRHLEIRGNAEYDRYTLRVFDYLNFFPFYVAYSRKHRADMPGVELLDEQGVPLFIDRFPRDDRFQSFQLLQREVHWQTFTEGIKNKFSGRSLKDVFDEWQTGFAMSSAISEQLERELIAKLQDPNVRYLDYFTGEYDHVAHLAEDQAAQLHSIESIDALVGRIWKAIERSPLADSTALVLISDHGMNTSEGVFSQGYSLVDWFASAAGGAQHVITNRHPLSEYKLMGLDPFVSQVTTPSNESAYLAGQSGDYPTVVMDLDGNERASIALRNNSLNILHVILYELTRKQLKGPLRAAAINAFFATRNREMAKWRSNINALQQELADLHPMIEAEEKRESELKKLKGRRRTKEQEHEIWRISNQLENHKEDERAYISYMNTISQLLALDPADFDPGKFKIEEIIPRKSLGELNSIDDLRHYVTGPAPGGLVLKSDGTLDIEKSFRAIDYFSALSAISVRNNVQRDVGPRPVDFIAVVLENSGEKKILLWSGDDKEALVEVRHVTSGERELRYTPVRGPNFEPTSWSSGFPLRYFEDANLELPSGADRDQWLSAWHTEQEWFRAVHRARYSNGIIGIAEQLLDEMPPPDQNTLSQYRARRRELRRTDMLVFANDHWNFNARGFNPGGNHGSFLRQSTHSVLMIAGGKNTGIPRGLRIEAPYDSLSFLPTILTLMGKPEPSLPGPLIKELTTTELTAERLP